MVDIRTSALANAAARLRMMAKQEGNKNISLMKWGLEYLPHHLSKPCSRLHETLATEYDRLRQERGQKLLIVAPRGAAKTTFSIVNILKAICESTERYIFVVSDTVGQAASILDVIKTELAYNERLRINYPIACKPGAVWNRDRIETASGVCVEALGTGQKVRGKKHKQYRPSLIVLDDPSNDEDCRSATTRQNQLEWFDRALSSCGDRNTNIVVIGTMIHRECLAGHLEKRPDHQVVKFAAVMQWPKRMDLWTHWEELYWSHTPKFINGVKSIQISDADEYYETNKEAMDEGAVILWPAVDSLYTLMQERAARGHAAFDSERQNNPRDPSKSAFPESWFEDCDYDYKDLQKRISAEKKITAMAIDPAMGGDSKRADYSPIVVLHYFGDCFYIECQATKIPVTTLTDNTLDWYVQTDAKILGVESNGFQALVGEELIAKAKAKSIFSLNLHALDNHGINKATRISRLSVWLQRKAFRFKRGCPHTRILLQQLQDFPNGDHDDLPDCLEMVLRIISEVTAGAEDFYADDGIGDQLV